MNEIPKVPSMEGGEGEKLVPSVESIKKMSEDLKTKIKEAKRQKEENLNQQLSDRETLLAELKQNEELINETKKGLETFNNLTQEELGLLDDSTKRDLIKFKELLISLTEQSKSITESIHSMETNPEVTGKLYEQATQEDNKIRAQEKEKEILERLSNQVDRFANEFILYEKLKDTIGPLESEIYVSEEKIRDSVEEARNNIKDKWRKSLPSYFQQVDEIKKSFSDLKNKISFFDRKSKRAIDSILHNQAIFEEYNKFKIKMEKLRTDIKEKEVELSKKYHEIMDSADSEQKSIDSMKGEATHWSQRIDQKLKVQLKELTKGKYSYRYDLEEITKESY